MPVPKSFKQTEQERQQVMKEISQALLPSVLDWAKSGDMLHGYMQNHFVDENGVYDVSFDTTWKAIKALKDVLIWKAAPSKTPQTHYAPSTGKAIRDLRGEREQQARDQAREDRERAERTKSLVQLEKNAQQNVAVNQRIEHFRSEIQNTRGRTHGQTAQIREKLTEALNKKVATKRNLLGMLELEDEFKTVIEGFWR